MISETSDDDLLRATQDQGQRFARSWWQASPETPGALRHLWPATLARLKQGDCLRDEDNEVLRQVGHAIIAMRHGLLARIDETPPERQQPLLNRKCLIEVVMLSFLSFICLRNEALARGLAAEDCGTRI